MLKPSEETVTHLTSHPSPRAWVNPLGLAGGGEASLFQRNCLRESKDLQTQERKKESLCEKSVMYPCPGLEKEQGAYNGMQLLEDVLSKRGFSSHSL